MDHQRHLTATRKARKVARSSKCYILIEEAANINYIALNCCDKTGDKIHYIQH